MSFENHTRVFYESDTIYFYLDNPLKCPLRYNISSSDKSINKLLREYNNIILEELTNTTVKIPANKKVLKTIKVDYFQGNMNNEVIKNKISLPFSKNKKYKITQGYKDNGTHKNIFAIDFGLKENDTIYAADDGYVIGVVDQNKEGGNDKKWLNNSNYLDIYHPKSGMFTGYGHFKYLGSLVNLGDFVKQGQPIAISGNTGYSSGPHLHFEVNIPVHSGWKTTSIEFLEGYKGDSLKKHDWVTK